MMTERSTYSHNHEKPQKGLRKAGSLLAERVVCCSICVLSVILKDAMYTISKEQAI